MSIPLRADLYVQESFRLETQALASVRRFIASTLSAAPEGVVYDIMLAVDEAMANAILHARPPAGARMKLTLFRQDDHVRIVLRNAGEPFDESMIPEVDLEAHVAEHRTHGLGLFLIRQVMDLVRFRTTRDGVQEVVMIKRVPMAC